MRASPSALPVSSSDDVRLLSTVSGTAALGWITTAGYRDKPR